MKPISLLLPILLLFISINDSANAKEANDHFFSEIPHRASVFGKYSTLLQRLYCPDLLYKMTFHNNLRNFHDLGLNKETKTSCNALLQSGYYVYYGGIWYVWKKKLIDEHPEQILATMNGTYTGLIKKKSCQHMKTKGKFIEFGYISSPMCGNHNKSDTGFFVYVAPYVYIYEKKIIPMQYIPAEVSLNGRYSDLHNVIRCDSQGEQIYDGVKMKDSGVVLEFDEESERSRLWPDQCGESLGDGHYVYRYPFWYAWKNKSPATDELNSVEVPRQ